MPRGPEIRLRGVYGRPWSQMVGRVTLDRSMLNKIGKILVREVVKEARKDFSKQGRRPTPRGEPEGIPDSKDFFKSFSYRIRGSSTIEVVSTWPWIEQIIEGRSPYKMRWLTQERGVHRVPMKQPDGVVLIRITPVKARGAWMHPGFAKHTFVERGVKNGKEAANKMIVKDFLHKLARGDPTR